LENDEDSNDSPINKFKEVNIKQPTFGSTTLTMVTADKSRNDATPASSIG